MTRNMTAERMSDERLAEIDYFVNEPAYSAVELDRVPIVRELFAALKAERAQANNVREIHERKVIELTKEVERLHGVIRTVAAQTTDKWAADRLKENSDG